MLKTVLVHVDDGHRCAHRLEVATRLAVDFQSKLVGLYLTPAPELSACF